MRAPEAPTIPPWTMRSERDRASSPLSGANLNHPDGGPRRAAPRIRRILRRRGRPPSCAVGGSWVQTSQPLSGEAPAPPQGTCEPMPMPAGLRWQRGSPLSSPLSGKEPSPDGGPSARSGCAGSAASARPGTGPPAWCRPSPLLAILQGAFGRGRSGIPQMSKVGTKSQSPGVSECPTRRGYSGHLRPAAEGRPCPTAPTKAFFRSASAQRARW
jgi:hypothetical protein